MNPELERLISLQRAENELRRVHTELAQIPQQKAALEAVLLEERGRLDAAREAQSGSQKARRTHEAGLQDLEGKRSKYKGQLTDVKTNKEYTALLHEIESVEREIRGLEDKILVEMEQMEGLAADVKREEGAFKQAEEKHRAAAKVVDDRLQVLNAEAEKLKAERDRVAATVNEDLLARFERIAKKRGTAVAEAKDGTCQECHVKLRPQLYSEVRRNEDITECPACSRILFFEPPVPVVTPETLA
jgi:predicted  nucleic acid-binding Zn-ribbon protein